MMLVLDVRTVNTYAQLDIQEIITITLDRESNIDFSSQHLAEIAAELDIDIDIIRSAEKNENN